MPKSGGDKNPLSSETSGEKRTRSPRRGAITGRYANKVLDQSKVEATIEGYGKVTLEKQGRGGLYRLVEPRGRRRVVREPNSRQPKIRMPIEVEVERPSKRPPEQISAHFYLTEADGLKAIMTAKAVIDFIQYLGYSEVKIVEAEQGSLRSTFKGFWNSEGGEKARKVVTKKTGDAYTYAERWAKDAFVEKQVAEITSTNVQNVADLLKCIENDETAVMHVGNLLVIKYCDVNGPKIITRQLSVPEMAAIESHSGILKDPAKAMEMLALVMAGGGTAEQIAP